MSVPAALLLLLGGDPFGVAAPVPDAQLADMRGGFRLPSGIDIALTVQTQTEIDGNVVLRTVFRADDGAPALAAYVPRAGTNVSAPRVEVRTGTAAGAPTVSYDSRTGVRVTPGAATAVVGVGSGDLGDIPAGLEVAGGGVAVDTRSPVQTAKIVSGDISIVHLAGAAFGSAIANTTNDRAIDPQTSVAIRVGNATPDVIGSTLFRVEGVALDALAGRVR